MMKEKLTILIREKFSYESWKQIRNLIDNQKMPVIKCEVDFRCSEFIDSSGLGSLLALQEKLGKDVKITLTNVNKGVYNVLRVANFESLFLIKKYSV